MTCHSFILAGSTCPFGWAVCAFMSLICCWRCQWYLFRTRLFGLWLLNQKSWASFKASLCVRVYAIVNVSWHKISLGVDPSVAKHIKISFHYPTMTKGDFAVDLCQWWIVNAKRFLFWSAFLSHLFASHLLFWVRLVPKVRWRKGRKTVGFIAE